MAGHVPSVEAPKEIDCGISIIPGLDRFPKCTIRFLTALILHFQCSELEMLQTNQRG
jgi:hypothetical protein